MTDFVYCCVAFKSEIAAFYCYFHRLRAFRYTVRKINDPHVLLARVVHLFEFMLNA